MTGRVTEPTQTSFFQELKRRNVFRVAAAFVMTPEELDGIQFDLSL
jgi:hypothetical protein